MTRRKYPPYARAIVAARQMGEHPDVIRIRFCTTWPREKREGYVLVFVHDYLAGEYFGFGWCRGVPVVLENVDAAETDFLRFVSDVASEAVPVYVDERTDELQDASAWMYLRRRLREDRQGYEWPAGWSDALDADYSARAERFGALTGAW